MPENTLRRALTGRSTPWPLRCGRPVWPSVLRLAAVASWIALIALSLLPGGYRPHTGASGNVEHALAYGLSAFVTRMAYRRTPSRFQLFVFAIASALFEILQIWIPGRTAAVENWAASAVGALAGLVAARTLAHRLRGDRSQFAWLRRHRS